MTPDLVTYGDFFEQHPGPRLGAEADKAPVRPGRPGVRVLLDQHAKTATGLGGGIDGNHLPAKGSNGHRGPAAQLNDRPAFELNTHRRPFANQGNVSPVDVNFQRALGVVGHKGRHHLPGADEGRRVAGVDAQDHAVARRAHDLYGLARQIDIDAAQLGAGLRHIGAQLLHTNTRLLELAARREALVKQVLHAQFVDLSDVQSGLCRAEFGHDLLALGAQTLQELGIVIDDAQDGIADLDPGTVAHIPLLDAARDQRIDLLHAIVGI